MNIQIAPSTLTFNVKIKSHNPWHLWTKTQSRPPSISRLIIVCPQETPSISDKILTRFELEVLRKANSVPADQKTLVSVASQVNISAKIISQSGHTVYLSTDIAAAEKNSMRAKNPS